MQVDYVVLHEVVGHDLDLAAIFRLMAARLMILRVLIVIRLFNFVLAGLMLFDVVNVRLAAYLV